MKKVDEDAEKNKLFSFYSHDIRCFERNQYRVQIESLVAFNVHDITDPFFEFNFNYKSPVEVSC